MKAILSNYNYDPEWLERYPELEVLMYDRSDDGIERNLTRYGAVLKVPNMGDVDYDKLTYLVENYDNLPEVFLWSKTNIFKFVDEPTFRKALENPTFTPLLKQDHKVYGDRLGEIAKYIGGIYAERADSWFFHAGLDSSGAFRHWGDWCDAFGLPKEQFIRFAPGGSYILTRERVHRYSRDFYDQMRATLNYAKHPVEAHCCERSYFLLWQ